MEAGIVPAELSSTPNLFTIRSSRTSVGKRQRKARIMKDQPPSALPIFYQCGVLNSFLDVFLPPSRWFQIRPVYPSPRTQNALTDAGRLKPLKGETSTNPVTSTGMENPNAMVVPICAMVTCLLRPSLNFLLNYFMMIFGAVSGHPTQRQTGNRCRPAGIQAKECYPRAPDSQYPSI